MVSVDSPFKVGVWPRAGPQVVRAWGPGLQGGVVGMSADFVVESICAEAGMLGMFIWMNPFIIIMGALDTQEYA